MGYGLYLPSAIMHLIVIAGIPILIMITARITVSLQKYWNEGGTGDTDGQSS